MRNIITIILSILATLPLRAQKEEHNNRLYITISDITEDRKATLILKLENPSTALTAVELYLTLPEGSTISPGNLSTRAISHELMEGPVKGMHFISITSPTLTPFTDSDGDLCTWLCDFSQAPNGEYTLLANDLFSVGVNDDSTIAYTTTNQTIPIVIDETKTTISNPTEYSGALIIHNIHGHQLNTLKKGEINIINGKKVKL